MKQIYLKFSMLLLCLVVGLSASADELAIDFEGDLDSYSSWTFTNIVSKATNKDVSPHGGDYYGTTGGKGTAYFVTSSSIANPKSITFYVSKQTTNTTASNWKVCVGSSATTNWASADALVTQSATNMTKGEWVKVSADLSEYSDVYVAIVYSGSTATRCIDDVTLEITDANTATAPTLPASCAFTTSSYDVTITNGETGATVYYTTDGSAPTTSSTSFTGASKTINITATTTVKAMAVISGKTNSSVATATYTKETSIANTEATAYTVAEVIALIDANSSQLATTKVYVKGIVSEIVTAYNSTYGNISFNVSADGTTTGQQFQFYRNQLSENDKYTEDPNIVPGGTVIGYGLLTKHNSTYEFSAGNYNVSYTAPAVTKNTATLTLGTYNSALITGFGDEYTVTYDGDATVTATSSDPTVATATIADGKVTITTDKAGKTTITIAAAETDNYYAANKSYTLTVTDPAPAAELPFTFDGGKADIANTTGMSQTGLSTDYNISPKLKFDGANDNLIINYASQARNVTYKLKGNSTDNTTVFDVLESADGKTYTTVHSHTGVPSDATSYTDKLKSDSRYVKFVYTTKKGNVALGAITITNEKADAGLAFEQSIYRFFTDASEMKVAATSSKGSTGAITYSCDNAKLTIDSTTGAITNTTTGTYTVTATIAETDDHKSGTATCIVKVMEPVIANSIIVAENENGEVFAMTNTVGTNTGTSYVESVQIFRSGDKYYVSAEDYDAIKYYSTTTDGVTTIVNMNGEYLQATAAKNVSFTEDEYQWTDDEGVLTATIGEKDVTLLHNSGAKPMRFTTYESKVGQSAKIVSLENVSTTYARESVSGKYGTICIPTSFTTNTVTVYSAELSEDKTTVELTEVSEPVAGTPYIYKANVYPQIFTIAGAPASAPVSASPLVGVFAATEVPVGDYVMQTKDGVQKFYKVAEGAQPTLSANKAYLTIPTSEAKALNIALAGEETAIKAVNALVNNEAKIYDLNGRELKTLQKGVNIVNGVKVLVK